MASSSLDHRASDDRRVLRLPPTYPFAATRFESNEEDVDAATVEGIIAPLRGAHDAMGGDGPWFSTAFTGSTRCGPTGWAPSTGC